jgi:hypothetical protein
LASGAFNINSFEVVARPAKRLVICLENSGHEVSLERRKIYVAIPDAKAARLGQVRVVDESGEDYLYPEDRFVFADSHEPHARRGFRGRTNEDF